MRAVSLVLIVLAGMARAEGERAGEFDYYVLALSWTPTWCAIEGDARGSDQCASGQGFGFTLHGLWPQYEAGWPSYCPSIERAPSRSMTAAEADIYGSSGLAWHQWNKHGTCTGLTAADYYALARQAYRQVNRPTILRQLDRDVRLSAAVIEEAFLEANAALSADGLTVTCRSNRIAEVRICLARDLTPRDCAPDVRRGCSQGDALFSPIR
ncbi:MAG: ribonuclease T2 [Pseudomonadota bacterium]